MTYRKYSDLHPITNHAQYRFNNSQQRQLPSLATRGLGRSPIGKSWLPWKPASYKAPLKGKKKPQAFVCPGPYKTAASYFPTWYRSIIGASELNFSVRNGLRWILTAITALFLSTGRISLLSAVYLMRKTTWYLLAYCLALLGALSFCSSKLSLFLCFSCHFTLLSSCFRTREALGLLVPLGFDIAAFTPAAYQRHSL